MPEGRMAVDFAGDRRHNRHGEESTGLSFGRTVCWLGHANEEAPGKSQEMAFMHPSGGHAVGSVSGSVFPAFHHHRADRSPPSVQREVPVARLDDARRFGLFGRLLDPVKEVPSELSGMLRGRSARKEDREPAESVCLVSFVKGQAGWNP